MESATQLRNQRSLKLTTQSNTGECNIRITTHRSNQQRTTGDTTSRNTRNTTFSIFPSHLHSFRLLYVVSVLSPSLPLPLCCQFYTYENNIPNLTQHTSMSNVARESRCMLTHLVQNRAYKVLSLPRPV